MKKWLLAIVVIAILGVAGWYYYYVADRGPGLPYGTGSPEGLVVDDASQVLNAPYDIDAVASGLEVPWSLVFTSPERLLVTERPGRLRVINNGQLEPEPLHVFPEVSTTGEEGLMGLALDPNYRQNHYLYVSLAYPVTSGLAVKVVRFTDDETSLSDEKVIIDNLPAAQYHAGCRLKFGPDGKLYITTGDATERQIAQDLNSLGGKILRLNADGSIPDDNPFPGSPIWSYGHRNPQGLAWSADGQLYSSEHGPTVFDGPRGGDEFNQIIKGANYGWPLVSHEQTLADTQAPLLVFTPSEAPASLLAYTATALPQFTGNFFFGALVGEGIVRIIVSGAEFKAEKLPEVHYGRIREVIEGPDGAIYFSTSNRDGRGKPTAEDDQILRIRPRIATE
jgi:glucose/arabinose dehydrogenase